MGVGGALMGVIMVGDSAMANGFTQQESVPPCHTLHTPPQTHTQPAPPVPKFVQEALLVADGVAARLLHRQLQQAAHHRQRDVALGQQQQHLRGAGRSGEVKG